MRLLPAYCLAIALSTSVGCSPPPTAPAGQQSPSGTTPPISGCSTDADCGASATCYTAFTPGLCVPSVGGTCGAGSCGSGLVCVQAYTNSGVCLPACDPNTVACTNGGACYPLDDGSGQGACEPACQTDQDCGAGSQCDQGVCYQAGDAGAGDAAYVPGYDGGSGSGDTGTTTTTTGGSGSACTANGNLWCANVNVCVNPVDPYWCPSSTPGTTGVPSTSMVDEDFRRINCANQPVYYDCSIAYQAEPPYPACQCAYGGSTGVASPMCQSQGLLTCGYDTAGDITCCPTSTGYTLTDSSGAPQCISDPEVACQNDPAGRCPIKCL